MKRRVRAKRAINPQSDLSTLQYTQSNVNHIFISYELVIGQTGFTDKTQLQIGVE